MKSKLSLTIVYIVLIIYFKVRLPNYTVAELEKDMKITLYACYNDALLPLWEHFMYDESSKKKEDTSNNKKHNQQRVFESQKCLEYFNSWKIQDDQRIHPIIDDTGPLKSGFSCSNGNVKQSKTGNPKEGMKKLEDDIVISTIQALASNIVRSVPQNKAPPVDPPPKENKSATQFGEYVPSIQQWEDRSRTKASRPPTCNC